MWSRRPAAGKAMAVVGAPGAGKTVTLLGLAYLAAGAGRKLCLADCKAPTPTLVPPLTDDTIPLPTADEPAPVGIAATVALAGRVVGRAGQRINQRRERAGQRWAAGAAAGLSASYAAL